MDLHSDISERRASERFRAARSAASVVAWAAWIVLVSWRLFSVPGMHMDEGWVIVSARGESAPADPLSGLTAYSGPFPRLLLEAVGTEHAIQVLRITSVLAGGATLLLIGRILKHFYGCKAWFGWGLPLIASVPVYLVLVRHAIEVIFITPLLSVLALYLYLRRTPGSSFAAGLCFGLSLYNHLLGGYLPLSAALAWLAVNRRPPPSVWRWAVLGFAVGIAPRALALVIYEHPELVNLPADYSVWTGVHDLVNLPGVLWDTLHGRTVYQRYVGHINVAVWPYWLLGAAFFAPWLRARRWPPRAAFVTLFASLTFAAIATVGSRYMAVRFLLLPCVGVVVFFVQLGAGAIANGLPWPHLVRLTGIALIAFNLVYAVANFYLPWSKGEVVSSYFFLGNRSRQTSSNGFFPKEELVKQLLELSPRPEQVIATPSLDLPLRALLADSGIQSTNWYEADRRRSSVYVAYYEGSVPKRACIDVPGGRMCFTRPMQVDRHFIIYR